MRGITNRDERGRTLRIHGNDEIRICPVCNDSYKVPAWKAIDKKRGKFCSKKCSYIGRELKGLFEKGHPDLVPKEKRGHSAETKAKMLIINREIAKKKNPLLWEERTHNKRKLEMHRYEYRNWRTFIFVRDNYTCVICGDNKSFLHVDHIKRWVDSEKDRYNIDNGRTLCFRCHFKETYPNTEYDEGKAIRWGIPPKYRKSGYI